MKINRHGRAKVLTQEEIQLLFNSGLQSDRDRALFGVCLYTACRIDEACTLNTADVYTARMRVRDEIIFRRHNTKGKLAARAIPVIDELRSLLFQYKPTTRTGFLFPGRHDRGHIKSDSAARILREACYNLCLEGVSTHSFRRTALTQMSNAGIPLRVIQEISGHRNLEELQKYLEVRPDQVRGAVSALSMLSHVGNSYVVKSLYSDVSSTPDTGTLESNTI
ncbi:tyrosine-type recombinase/integrase [Tolypothrix campylonemoides VB511288_2]|uniref:Integrase n=3 Tax=Nostocales TaxID=1161 RepID=A0A0C1NAX7_9CYAN